MDARDPVVLRAIRNIEERYSPEDWWAMPPRQRAGAIYAEIGRLDALALEEARASLHQQEHPPLVYAVA
jgi:hypothetical protein